MITLRSIPLYLAPTVAFAIITWVILCLIAPPEGFRSQAELVGWLALGSAGVGAYTAGRLYRHRETADLRIPFFLNAAGLAILLGWFALSLFGGLWQALVHRAA